MQNVVQTEKMNKGFIKAGDLQRQLGALRREQPDIRPIDAANALLPWFQHPDNEHIRLDVLYYAITHAWGIVTDKLDTSSAVKLQRVEREVLLVRAEKSKRKKAVAKAVDEALEQMVATLRSMTFKQARMLHGATAKLDLKAGADDQRLCDVFSDDEIRAALG